MNDKVKELAVRGIALSTEDRTRLVDLLLESLHESPKNEVEAAWAIEIERRLAAYDSGEIQSVAGEDVFAKARILTARRCIMNLDPQKIDDAILALLQLGLHDGDRVWKTFDWDAMNRLHAKGLISEPVGKAKSVVLTEGGMDESNRLLAQLFGED